MMLRKARWSGWDRLAICSLALCLGLALTGCGGGDDEASSPTCLDLDFAGALISVSPGDVFLRPGPQKNCSTVDVEIRISNISGIWTVSFDLVYPQNLLTFDMLTLGPLLQKGNPINTPLVIVGQSSGALQVSMTRLFPDPSVTAAGGEVLATVRFRRLAVGSGLIDFDLSPGSPVGETILDEFGNAQPSASFGPGHGGVVMVP
jgi:hypothetical protein